MTSPQSLYKITQSDNESKDNVNLNIQYANFLEHTFKNCAALKKDPFN